MAGRFIDGIRTVIKSNRLYLEVSNVFPELIYLKIFNMNRYIIMIAMLIFSASCKNSDNEIIEYPETKKIDHADTLFGTIVADPYRWLEDDMSEETAQWVKEQNSVTFGYLEKISLQATDR